MRGGVENHPPGKARLAAAGNGYLRFAPANPELFRLMFSRTLCNADDPDLTRAARAGYDVLRGVAQGLDWDKADAPDGPMRTEWMLGSVVHGYAMLLIGGQIPRAETGAPLFDMAELMPDFDYRPAAVACPPVGEGD